MIWKRPIMLILVILALYFFNVLAGWMWMGLGLLGICLCAWAYFDKGPARGRIKGLIIGLVLIGTSAGMNTMSFFVSSRKFWFLVGSIGVGLCLYAFHKKWLRRTSRAKYFIGGTTMATTAVYVSGFYNLVALRCVSAYGVALQSYVKIHDKITYVLSMVGIS